MSYNEFSELQDFIEKINEERNQLITEVADWDDPKKIKKDKDTVSCDDDERYERQPIRKAIQKMFSGVSMEDVNAAIEHCCKKKGQSRLREDFYKCVYLQITAK